MKVTVTLNQQQYMLIELLRKEGHLGTTDEEIIRNVFREALKEEGQT